jgi:HlyD family secretion protein
MKTIGVLIAVVVVAVGGWLGYARYVSGDKESGFVTKPLDRGDIVKTVAATGTIEPMVKVIIGSQVSGKIKKWYADFNAQVKEGGVLAEIEPDRFQTAFDQSKADLALAKAREEELLVKYKDAERERKRVEALLA